MGTRHLLYSLTPVPPPWPLFLVLYTVDLFHPGRQPDSSFPLGVGRCISVVPSGISQRDMGEAPSKRHLTVTAPSDTRLHRTNVLSLMRDDVSFFFLKGTTEDEMAGWPHQLNGHEFE